METRSKSKWRSVKCSKTRENAAIERSNIKKNAQGVDQNRADNGSVSNQVNCPGVHEKCHVSRSVRITRRSGERKNLCETCVACKSSKFEKEHCSSKTYSFSNERNSTEDNVSKLSMEKREQSSSEPTISENSGPTISENRGPAKSENRGSALSEPTISENSGPTISENSGPTISENREPTISGNSGPAISESRGPALSENSWSTESATLSIPTCSQEPNTIESDHTYANKNLTHLTDEIWGNIMKSFELSESLLSKYSLTTKPTFATPSQENQLVEDAVGMPGDNAFVGDGNPLHTEGVSDDKCSMSVDQGVSGMSPSLANQTGDDAAKPTINSEYSGRTVTIRKSEELAFCMTVSEEEETKNIKILKTESESCDYGQKHSSSQSGEYGASDINNKGLDEHDENQDDITDEGDFENGHCKIQNETKIHDGEHGEGKEVIKTFDKDGNDKDKDRDQYEDSDTQDGLYNKRRSIDKTVENDFISVDLSCAGNQMGMDNDSGCSEHIASFIEEYCDTIIQYSLKILESSNDNTEPSSTSKELLTPLPSSPLPPALADEPPQNCFMTDFIGKLCNSGNVPETRLSNSWYFRLDDDHSPTHIPPYINQIPNNNNCIDVIDHFDYLFADGPKELDNEFSFQNVKNPEQTSDVSIQNDEVYPNEKEISFKSGDTSELEDEPFNQEKAYADLWSAVEEDLASNSYESLERFEDVCGWRPELDNILQGNRVNHWRSEDFQAFEAVDPSLILDVLPSPVGYQGQYNCQPNINASQDSGESNYHCRNSLELSLRSQVYVRNIHQNYHNGSLDSSGSPFGLSDDSSSSTLSCSGDNCYDSDLDESLSLSCLYETYDSSDESDSYEDEHCHLSSKQLSPLMKTPFTPARAQLSTSGIETDDFLFLEKNLPSSCLDKKLQQEWGICSIFDVDDVFPYQNMSKDVYSDYSDKPKFKAYDHSFFTVERRHRYNSTLHQGYHTARKASPTLQSCSRRSRHASVPGTSSPVNTKVSRALFLQDLSPSNARGISPYCGGTWRKQLDFEMQNSDSDDLADLSVEDTVDFFMSMSSPMKSGDEDGK